MKNQAVRPVRAYEISAFSGLSSCLEAEQEKASDRQVLLSQRSSPPRHFRINTGIGLETNFRDLAPLQVERYGGSREAPRSAPMRQHSSTMPWRDPVRPKARLVRVPVCRSASVTAAPPASCRQFGTRLRSGNSGSGFGARCAAGPCQSGCAKVHGKRSPEPRTEETE